MAIFNGGRIFKISVDSHFNNISINCYSKISQKVGIILNETLSKKSDTVLSWLVAASEKVLGLILLRQICPLVFTNL